MPAQFTPTDRQHFREMVESQDFVQQTTPCGPGIMAETEMNKAQSFTTLTVEHGWYVDKSIDTGNYDQLVLMPITEVNVDEQ